MQTRQRCLQMMRLAAVARVLVRSIGLFSALWPPASLVVVGAADGEAFGEGLQVQCAVHLATLALLPYVVHTYILVPPSRTAFSAGNVDKVWTSERPHSLYIWYDALA